MVTADVSRTARKRAGLSRARFIAYAALALGLTYCAGKSEEENGNPSHGGSSNSGASSGATSNGGSQDPCNFGCGVNCPQLCTGGTASGGTGTGGLAGYEDPCVYNPCGSACVPNPCFCGNCGGSGGRSSGGAAGDSGGRGGEGGGGNDGGAAGESGAGGEGGAPQASP